MKITGCSIGIHSDVKMTRELPKEEDASCLATPIPASEMIPKSVVVVSETEPTKAENLQPFLTPGGFYKCVHAGCGKEYSPDSNGNESCHFHSGKAGFRDTRKFWSCCNASSYDWDEFMKIPTCCIGSHQPKLVPTGLS